MTYLGAPMIYYGDEAGMWGAKDPCCRKPMIWDDRIFDDERYLPDGHINTKAETVKVNMFLLNHYKKLIELRNTYKVLQLGDIKTLYINDPDEVYAFTRNYEGTTAIIVINNNLQKVIVEIPLEYDAQFKDVLNDIESIKTKDRKLSLTVSPKWGEILIKQ